MMEGRSSTYRNVARDDARAYAAPADAIALTKPATGRSIHETPLPHHRQWPGKRALDVAGGDHTAPQKNEIFINVPCQSMALFNK